MSKVKKSVSIILSLLMIISLFTLVPLTADAGGRLKNGDWKCDLLEDGTAEIEEYKGSDSEVIIPSELIGYKVTRIGSFAFSNCTSLTSVTIPDSITSIGDSAFKKCTSLTSIIIPDSVTSIDKSAFEDTAYYKNENNWEDNVLYIGKHLIKAKEALYGEYSIKSGTFTISNDAFYSCQKLTNITIPDSVTNIGEWAFYYCKNLKNVTIGNSVSSIYDYAFCDCASLTSIVISDSVTSIGENAFKSCTSLTDINVSDNNEVYSSIDGNLYNKEKTKMIKYAVGKDDESFIIPESVKEIQESAFEGCTSIKSVTIPDSVGKIGNAVFRDCTSLNNIDISDSVASISSFNAFYNTAYYNSENNWKDKVLYIGNHLIKAKGLNEVNASSLSLSDSYYIKPETKTIAGYAFDYCTKLTSVYIPDSVISIGNGAFCDCYKLTSINIPDGITSIEEFVFDSCKGLTSIEIPNSVTSIGEYAFRGCKGLTSIVIPDSVTSIGKSAYDECEGLKSITIGNSVKSLGDSVFIECTSLTSIEIPDSVINIGRCAFYDCTCLESITISDSVKRIGEYAFAGTAYYDDELNWEIYGVLYLGPYLLEAKEQFDTSYAIKPGTKVISDSAFERFTDLTSIRIPESVINIGDKACGWSKDSYGFHVKQLDFSVYGYKGTAAEDYANENKFIFKDYDKYDESSSEAVEPDTYTTETEPADTTPVVTTPSVTNPTQSAPIITEPIEPVVTQPSNPAPSKPTVASKKANTITVKAKTVKIKAKKLKKKAQKVRAITVKNNVGKVSYKLVKSGITKKIRKLVKINSKGVITIKKWKKAKKGTYKIKVTVKAAGNTNYNAKTITKTVKVKVK